jgi:uncharacterized membrane protein YfcA
MTGFELALLAAMMFAAATLYTSVGHAGASGYLAAMALMGLAPAVMKPTALAINILVASLATARWTRNGRDLDEVASFHQLKFDRERPSKTRAAASACCISARCK